VSRRRRGGFAPRRVTVGRARQHLPQEDPDAPGTCATCHLPLGTTSDRHLDQLPAVDPAITAHEARRLGEHEED
jgi:hypothetical protein